MNVVTAITGCFLLFVHTASAQYCTPTNGNDCTSTFYENINDVTINGTTNPAGCVVGSYLDLTTDTFHVTAGSCVTFIGTINNFFTGDGFSVFADWNNNQDFSDPGETLLTITNSGITATGNIAIPANIPPGSYRIRVRLYYNTGFGDPCIATTYGETVDYTLVVGGNTSVCTGVGAVATTDISLTGATINWGAAASPSSYIVQYKLSSASVWTSVSVPGTDTFTVLSALDTCTSYDVQIFSVCTTGDTSAASCPFQFSTQCCFDPIPTANHIEAEACGQDLNGGCYTNTGYEPIACGDTVAGTAWYDGNFTLDYDWYALTITQDTFVQVKLKSAFPGQLYLYDSANGCFSAALSQANTIGACDTTSFGLNLAAGTYWILVQPQETFATAYPCGGGSNAYQLIVNCAAPLPAPANDNCANAIMLIEDTVCNYQTFSTAQATQSQVGCSGTANDDVWFSFVATTANPVISVLGSSSFDAVFQVYDSCQGTALNCVDATGVGQEEATQMSGLIVGNTYYVRVYDFGAGTPSNPTFQICVSEPFEYCHPTVAICDEFISNVTLNGLSHASGCTAGGYVDYSDSLAFSAQVGSCQTLVVNIGPPYYTADGISVFVDWNHDFDFNGANENLATVNSNTGGVVSTTIYIPGNIPLGNYRMRVRLYYNTGFGDPCVSSIYGEIEDYTLSVTSGGGPCRGVGFLSSANETLNSATVHWGPSATAMFYHVRYKLASDTVWSAPIAVNAPDTLYNLAGLDTCAAYEVQIQSVCAGGDTSNYSCAFSFHTVCCLAPLATANHIEAEACGQDVNGGCNMAVPHYEPVACGDTVAGTGWWDGTNRDTDWFILHLSQDSSVNLTLTAAFNSALFILDSMQGCFATPTYVVNSTAQCQTTSLVTNLTAGTYWIFVGPQFDFANTVPCGSGHNNYVLTVNCYAPLPAPANDSCQNAITIACGDSISGTTNNATPEGFLPYCNTFGNSNGVWYKLIGDGSIVTLSMCDNTNYDAQLNVFTGTCDNFVCVNGNNDGCGSFGGPAQLTFPTMLDSVYYVFVSGTIGAYGNFSLKVNCQTPPAYDNVCGALALNFGTNGPFNTALGSVQPGEPAPPGLNCQTDSTWCNNTITNTLWFTFVAPASGHVTIQSPSFDTQLAVWSADSCQAILIPGGATLVGANDDDPNAFAHGGVTFSSYLDLGCVTPGKTYYVQLDPYFTPDTTRIILTDAGPLPSAAFSGLNTSYCPGSPVATLTPVTPGGTFSGPGVVGSTFNPTLAGIGGPYQIIYKLSKCNADTMTTTVTNLNITSVVTQPPCSGAATGAIDLTVTGGVIPYSFSWNILSADEDLFNIGPGVYSVTVNDAAGCTGTLSDTLTANAPTVISNITNATCANTPNGAINISVSSGVPPYNYAWSNGSTSASLTNIASGTYYETISDATGCQLIDTFIVTSPAAMNATINVINPIMCAGNSNGSLSVVVTNGTTPYTYHWNNNATTATLANLAVGTYTVTVTDANGCSVTQTHVLNSTSPALDLSVAHQNVGCNGSLGAATATVTSGGTPPFTYHWNNNATTSSLNNLNAGTYTVTVTDANGCTASSSATVLGSGAGLNVSLSPTGPLTSCYNAFNVTLSATQQNGIMYTFYSGTPGSSSMVQASSTDNTYQPNSVGTHTYFVVANDAGTGCADTSNVVSVTLNELPQPVLVTQACIEKTIHLSVTPVSANYTYQWMANGVDVPGQTGTSYTVSGAGTYQVRMTDTCNVSKVSDPLYFNGDCFSTGINQLAQKGNGMLVFPNPNDGNFSIEAYYPNVTASLQLQVVNVLGQIVYAQPLQLTDGYAHATLDLNKLLPDGMYNVRLQSATANATRGIVITHQ